MGSAISEILDKSLYKVLCYRMRKSRLTETQILEVQDRYLSGESSETLAREYPASASHIRSILKKRGIPIRSLSASKTKYSLNTDAFKYLTPEAEYWAGFLFADGCIYRNSGGKRNLVVRLGISEKDHEHILKFKAFLEAVAPVRTVVHKNSLNSITGITTLSSINLCCHTLAVDLIELGLRGDRIPCEKLEFSRHFWRGMIDGDGSISSTQDKKVEVTLCGKPLMLEKFQNFIKSIGIHTNAKIRAGVGVHYLHLTTRKAKDLLECLYQDGDTGLDRKIIRAQDILEKYRLRDKV